MITRTEYLLARICVDLEVGVESELVGKPRIAKIRAVLRDCEKEMAKRDTDTPPVIPLSPKEQEIYNDTMEAFSHYPEECHSPNYRVVRKSLITDFDPLKRLVRAYGKDAVIAAMDERKEYIPNLSKFITEFRLPKEKPEKQKYQDVH